jgi:hypothetical protein
MENAGIVADAAGAAVGTVDRGRGGNRRGNHRQGNRTAATGRATNNPFGGREPTLKGYTYDISSVTTIVISHVQRRKSRSSSAAIIPGTPLSLWWLYVNW